MKQTPILLVVSIFLVGCVTTAAKLNELRPGMERTEVVKLIGTPTSTGFIDGAEYLYYRLPRSGHEAHMSRGMAGQDYAVRLVNGRVDSYGRTQDVVPVRVNTTGEKQK